MRKPALLLLPCLHSPCAAAVLATGSAPAVPWTRIIVALALCLGIAWAAILLLRRHQRGGGTPGLGFTAGGRPRAGRIAILETRRASQHGDLCLAELDGELYFLALTPAGATLLRKPARLDGPSPADEAV